MSAAQQPRRSKRLAGEKPELKGEHVKTVCTQCGGETTMWTYFWWAKANCEFRCLKCNGKGHTTVCK